MRAGTISRTRVPPPVVDSIVRVAAILAARSRHPSQTEVSRYRLIRDGVADALSCVLNQQNEIVGA